MCSRYNLMSPVEAVRAYFRLKTAETFPPRSNIAPTQPVHIVRLAPSGERELVLVRWGLIPGWAKEPGKLSLITNARAETAAEKPSFRGALRHRRCLIPADGFYEWTGPARARIPHLFRPRGAGLMAMAGLWEHWLGADGSEMQSMAILTVAANRMVAPMHDRMPLIVSPDVFDLWLDCRSSDANPVLGLMQPAPDELLECYEVSPRLNNARNQEPELVEPVRRRLL
ncbi:MAG: SOS response-associated peptidase [Proteobacteria bacterium]|nr:SOS response-associated peptidase [Pseudomonadota bacterium]